jgi:hypothetical protein
VINHCRTLLLNRPGVLRPAPTYFLEEYVDPSFQPVALPTYLAAVRNILIGQNSDDAFSNYRLWQLFRTVVAGTEYQHYVTDLDPRVTYLRRRAVVDTQNTVSYVSITPNAPKLYFAGTPAADPSSSRLQNDWLVEATGLATITTTLIQTGQTNSSIISTSENLSDLIPLAGQVSLSFRIATTLPLVIGTTWNVTAFARPVGDLSLLLPQLARIGDAALFELFPNREPYQTFSALWTKHIYVPERITGMILAYAYRAEEVRTGVG